MIEFNEIEWRAPIEAFAAFSRLPHAHLLHAGDQSQSDWSTIVAFPTAIVEGTGEPAEFLEEIDRIVASRAMEPNSSIDAPFQSGLVGFVGYEALNRNASADVGAAYNLPASPHPVAPAVFGVYDGAIVFSRSQQRGFIVAHNTHVAARLHEQLMQSPDPASQIGDVRLSANFSKKEYKTAIEATIERIRDGAFYQANLSQCLTARFGNPQSCVDIFRRLAAISDAEFGAILQYDDASIISNAPERFFRVDTENAARRIVVEPIKGTRGRDVDPVVDAQHAAALLCDEKDRAENTMIADLMRNDLSKICCDDSICEDAICELLTLSRVHHLVSRISGVISDGVAVSDIFRALFPSGSITGAPKLAAMRQIANVERVGRGPYCGALGYIDDRGDMDFSVAIRTMTLRDGGREMSIPVGGGITLRSSPEEEYQETLVKARAALDALGVDRDGLEALRS